MGQSLYDYCHTHKKEYLLAEWDGGKNLPLTPENVSYGSKKRVSWRCEKGHEWRAIIKSRAGARKNGCPVCAGRINKARQVRYEAILKDSTWKRR